MAEAAGRSSGNTELYIGTLKAEIGLFGTDAKPASLAGFETAGPNGGVLKTEMRAAASPLKPMETKPVAEGSNDPFADPGPEEGKPEPEVPVERGALVDGQFVHVLVEDGTGEVVAPEDVRKGIRLENGNFVDCTDQLTAITERTKLDRMEVVATIDATKIRRQRVVKSYYVGAQKAADAVKLRIFYEGLRNRREVAVVKYTTRSRQQLGIIETDAKTGTLVLLSLVWTEDWREVPDKAKAVAGVEVRTEHVAAMWDLLEALHDSPDVVDTLRDDAIALREELVVRAQSGEMTAEVVEPLPVVPEVDLEDALTASLEAVRAGAL